MAYLRSAVWLSLAVLLWTPPAVGANVQRTEPPAVTQGPSRDVAPPPPTGPPAGGQPPPSPGGQSQLPPPDRDDDEDEPPRTIVDWLFPLLRGLPHVQPPAAGPQVRIAVSPGAAPRRPAGPVRSPRVEPPRSPGNPPPPRATPAPTAAVAGEVLEQVVLVALNAGSDRTIEASIGADLGLAHEVAYESPVLGLRVVRFRIPATTSIAAVLAALANDADVVSAQPEFVYRAIGGAAAARPAAALPQYAAEKLRIGEAHAMALGRRVRVAVIDTALDSTHPELTGAIASSFNALGEPSIAAEPHGTAIAGILAARAVLKGVAPGAQVLAVSAFRTSGSGAARSSTLALVKGIDWALAKGARVVNMSFAGPEDPLLGKAIASAAENGLIMVAAAGNAGPAAPPAFPAAYPEVIAVTATDAADRLYAKANRGSYVSIAAPGVDIMAPAPKGQYEVTSGTSMAAAHVSGVVALLLERQPDLKADGIRDILRRSARKPASGPPSELGAGVVDAAGALRQAR